MKYLEGLFIGLIFFSFGCSSTVEEDAFSEVEQFEIDLDLIDNWLTLNIKADTLHHYSDIRYTINEVGTGTESPERYDVVKVAYEGRFLDTGEVFDSNGSLETVISQTIQGWQFMVPEMVVGDEYTIYIPSKYCYGRYGNQSIAPNTILVFDIKLLRIGI
jgi:FKBP-type peptidyl-prolyl cis-trans isomerase